MSKKNESKLVPKLRFPEFKDSGDWNERPLGEVTYQVSERNKDGNKYPIYSISNISGFVPQSEQFEGVDSHARGYDISLYKIIKENTFAYNPARINIGSLGYSGELNNIIISSLYVCFKTKSELDDLFLLHYLKTAEFSKTVKQRVEGGIRSYLFYENLASIKVQFPSKIEQQKIADCLSSLDDVITAESQKLEALKAHKKGLLQNLFPQEGETVPKLRFKEFEDSGEWEEKWLGNICLNIASGRDKNVEDGEFDLYGSTGIIGKINQASYEGKYILVARVGANAGLLTKAIGKFGVTDNTLVIHLHNPEYSDFVYYLLEQFNLNKLVFGSGQPLITGGQLKSLTIFEPKQPDEKQKIASFLSSLDKIINAQSKKVETLKLHKQGLLQCLFPNLNGVSE